MYNVQHPDITHTEKFGSRQPREESGQDVVMIGGRKLSYIERLRRYEAEKRQLWNTRISVSEYETTIKALANKWKI